MKKESAAPEEGLKVSREVWNLSIKFSQQLSFSAGPLDKRRRFRPTLRLEGLHPILPELSDFIKLCQRLCEKAYAILWPGRHVLSQELAQVVVNISHHLGIVLHHGLELAVSVPDINIVDCAA